MPHRVALVGLAALMVAGCGEGPTQAADLTPNLRAAAKAGSGDGRPLFTESYDFDAPVPCEGLSRNGVAYAFSIGEAPSADCVAGTTYGPPNSTHVLPPNVEANGTGTLTLTFDVPTTSVGFGVLVHGREPQAEAVEVDLYRPGVGLLRERLSLDVTPDPVFVGGRFTYEGPAVRSISIRMAGDYPRFVLDDLTYAHAPGRSN